MNKNFIRHILLKPDKYILVWTYIYSRLDEKNHAHIYIYEIMTKYKVSKSTMKRIVDYGSSFSELEMNYKWISNYLTISIVDNVGEPVVISKKTQSERKTTKKRTLKPANTLYSKMIEQYDKFCLNKTGVGCKIDGVQGKSMKRIIKFLETQCKKKDEKLENEELDNKVLLAWEYILLNWDKLDDFNRGRIKLTEIDSNMLNILIKLKEQPTNKKQKQRKDEISKAIRDAEATDYSKLGTRQ